MLKYIAYRLLLFIPTLVGATLLIFLFMRVIPGDIAHALLSGYTGEVPVTEEQLVEFRHQIGLDRALPIQYIAWVRDMLQGDFGQSYFLNVPIMKVVKQRLPLTLELATFSTLLGILIAIPSGVLSAVKQDTWLDYLVRTVTIGGVAIPTVLAGIIILIFLIAFFNTSPTLGAPQLWEEPVKHLKILAWPVVALGYRYAAILSRMTLATMLEVLREDYIRTARAKGLHERIVVYRHALSNAILPVITLASLQWGQLLGGAVIVEKVFTLPGMGTMLIDAILNRDFLMVQVMVSLLVGIYLIVNLVVDLAYTLLDPRVRYA